MVKGLVQSTHLRHIKAIAWLHSSTLYPRYGLGMTSFGVASLTEVMRSNLAEPL